jgi:methylenetetrahydrofolate dehydrogenase (NADP+)/methenyltetrahydrofolate cyclohydrolase
MQIIDGKSLADTMLSDLSSQIKKLDKPPVLAYVLCTSDTSAHAYADLKIKAGNKIGVETRRMDLPESTTKAELISKLSKLSADDTVNGILVQFPLFPHLQTDAWEIMQSIAPHKDVDGLTAVNQGRLSQNLPATLPATVAAVLECLQSTQPEASLEEIVKGKNVVIVNHSSLVGKPLAMALLNLNATVTVAHQFTGELPKLLQSADIVITATGQTDLFKADDFKQGAIVIDVTSIKTDAGIKGDVINSPELESKLTALTPVPGGVGPLTIACLMRNLVNATKLT